jgi:hypothetical protein
MQRRRIALAKTILVVVDTMNIFLALFDIGLIDLLAPFYRPLERD